MSMILFLFTPLYFFTHTHIWALGMKTFKWYQNITCILVPTVPIVICFHDKHNYLLEKNKTSAKETEGRHG